MPGGVLREAIALTNDARLDVPSTMICTGFTSEQYKDAVKDGYAWLGGVAELRDVTWVDLPTSHWPMWSRPRELAAIIGDVAKADARTRGRHGRRGLHAEALVGSAWAAMLIASMLGGIPAARAGGRGRSTSRSARRWRSASSPTTARRRRATSTSCGGRMQQQIPGLSLRNLGCPGETSHSMITGTHPLCRYPEGSQLDAAVAFLQAHPGQVAFITVEVGANDFVAGCLRDTVPARPGVRGRPAPTAAGQADAASSTRWPRPDRACRSSA